MQAKDDNTPLKQPAPIQLHVIQPWKRTADSIQTGLSKTIAETWNQSSKLPDKMWNQSFQSSTLPVQDVESKLPVVKNACRDVESELVVVETACRDLESKLSVVETACRDVESKLPVVETACRELESKPAVVKTGCKDLKLELSLVEIACRAW
ncbi:hypothetical protein BD769DRAFT_1683324 [Suillus cothurnatus]|nr:hypothetical protein BD769DRAFT_1683324 [Suillus cothurnatus]